MYLANNVLFLVDFMEITFRVLYYQLVSARRQSTLISRDKNRLIPLTGRDPITAPQVTWEREAEVERHITSNHPGSFANDVFKCFTKYMYMYMCRVYVY